MEVASYARSSVLIAKESKQTMVCVLQDVNPERILSAIHITVMHPA